ncbi:MAG: M23 family metallopeptidase [Deltaproteobacteria bacterium]|nr:M23 family metallopeptidase [Deltaproteobacteria bacterium]
MARGHGGGIRARVLAALALMLVTGAACTQDADPADDAGDTPASPPDVPLVATPPPVVPASAFALPGLDAHRPQPRLGWPVQSVHITSHFGWRVDPVSGRGTRLHRGVDFRGTPGDLVLSIGAGRIDFVGHDPFLGTMVVVDHGQGLRSLYGHLSDVLVVAQMPVERGAAIGLVGNTGRSEAPHLHLTVKLDGVAIDPLDVLGEPLHRPEALIGGPEISNDPPAPAPDPAETTELAAPPQAVPPRIVPSHRSMPHRSDDGGP